MRKDYSLANRDREAMVPRDMRQVDRLRKIAEEMDKIRERTRSIEENLAAKIIRESRDKDWNE